MHFKMPWNLQKRDIRYGSVQRRANHTLHFGLVTKNSITEKDLRSEVLMNQTAFFIFFLDRVIEEPNERGK